MNSDGNGTSYKDRHALVASVAPAPGSDFYYATLYCAEQRRAQVHAFESVRREITRIPSTCSDRGVAHTKLAWWYEELERTPKGEPRHELTTAFEQLVEPLATASTVLQQLVETVDSSLIEQTSDTSTALEALLLRHHRDCIVKLTLLATDSDVTVPDSVIHLGCMLERSYFVRGLRLRRSEPTLYIATEGLRAFGLTSDDLRFASGTDAIRDWVRSEVEQLHGALKQTLALLSKAEKRRFQIVVCLAMIQAKALELCMDDQCSVLERRIELTPLSKLVYALRTRWGV